MCMGGGRKIQEQVQQVQPVRALANPDELSPTIELASEDALEIAKKKKSKKGTSMLQTDLNIPGSTTMV